MAYPRTASNWQENLFKIFMRTYGIYNRKKCVLTSFPRARRFGRPFINKYIIILLFASVKSYLLNEWQIENRNDTNIILKK